MLREATALDARGMDLYTTLESGQSFRWKKLADNTYEGVAGDKYCRVEARDGMLLLYGCLEEDTAFWRDYFDLDRDYLKLEEIMSSQPVLSDAVKYASGARMLRQEPWETLCSFIISQNNNVKRISGIVERLCESFGRPLANGRHAFPAPQALAGLSPDDLAPLRCGFRAKYIIDAANKIASGEVLLPPLYDMHLDGARAELMKIYGVGKKVADCALLYGFGRIEAFPVDVWIKRAMEQLFPNGLPEAALPFAGIAQLYIFHYARTCPGSLPGLKK